MNNLVLKHILDLSKEEGVADLSHLSDKTHEELLHIVRMVLFADVKDLSKYCGSSEEGNDLKEAYKTVLQYITWPKDKRFEVFNE